MRRSRFGNRWLLVAGLLIAAAVAGWWLSHSRPKYNVLLVTLDTTRADHIGCYGDVDAHTPVLDALARDGVVFESAYVTVPLTLPSHASILTGLYPPENGMHTNGRGRLETSLPNLAETLRGAGYSTSAFIASVVLHSRYGLDHGFDVYDDDMAGGEVHGHESHLMRNADVVVNSALSWLRRRDDNPFFCWVHLFDPHAPYEGHPEIFRDRFLDRPYDGDIAFADLHVGRLVKYLREEGLYENTIIVVVGDHGEGLGEHLEEEHGFMLYNSTARVPLIVSCPEICQAGHRVKQAVSQVDIFPTVLDCLGLDSPGRVSGFSFRRALAGSPISSRPCYSETIAVHDAYGWAPLASIADENWKYVQTSREELYHLKDDPSELNNLAETQPDRLEELREKYESIQQNMVPHTATDVSLTDAERRALGSLGYSAIKDPRSATDEAEVLPDVKDMMVYYNAEIAARKLIGEGHADTAIEQLRDVIQKAPDFIPARMTLGMALQEKDRLDEAKDVFLAAIDVDPQSSTPHFELGKLFAAEGETAKAIEHYSTAIRLNPQDATSHFNLGSLLFSEGDVDAAREHYEVGLEEFPDSVVGQFNLSVLLSDRGDLDAAWQHAKRAAELSPRNPQIQFHFGKVCASMGKFEDAALQFELTLQLAPGFPQGQEFLNEARKHLSTSP